VVPGDGTEVWGKIHMNRGRVGEERRGEVRKQTYVPLQPAKILVMSRVTEQTDEMMISTGLS
jgi:hypothetical protein